MAAFIREGLTMAPPTKPVGIKKKKGAGEITIPEFTMPPTAVPGIAQVIVDAWQGKASLNQIMDRNPAGAPNAGMATLAAVKQATDAINAAAPGFSLKRAVIISELEHDNGYTVEFDDDVVFVLPRASRVNGPKLLQTAELLMACTPNGI